MAKALKCDICRGFFEYDPNIPNTIEYYYINESGICLDSKYRRLNCCPVCFGEIAKIIEDRDKLKEVKDEPADN